MPGHFDQDLTPDSENVDDLHNIQLGQSESDMEIDDPGSQTQIVEERENDSDSEVNTDTEYVSIEGRTLLLQLISDNYRYIYIYISGGRRSSKQL